MNVEMNNKRPMEFNKIRNGTVFKCEDTPYLKGDDDYATNLTTGHILKPNDSDQDAHDWSVCYIYPRASLKI